jgi:alpha-amylase/alpha-mannosidase (GH57 family)
MEEPTRMSTPLVIHGHFYQPPRENPWTGRIDPEPSAAPYPNWNERILAECYRPNAFAHIFHDGQVERTVNNYAGIQFDFGPTLMHWLERRDPETYGKILEADTLSRRALGHGHAIAQGYNHAILPLMDERDRRTQVRWGLADFRFRFGRDAEGMWLPETAANDATLDTLIEEGVRYTILAPRQAKRVRMEGERAWLDVDESTAPTGRACRYRHQDGSGRSIAIFFYDGKLANGIAFGGALATSQTLADAVERARPQAGGLVQVATDGESYGHHFRFGDLTLAYALDVEFAKRGFALTNYATFLERFPPRTEVEIDNGPDGEGTSWSCAHGVGRWQTDCGCHVSEEPDWNQKWRGPMRAAFDLLRDASRELFVEAGSALFRDPWEARDDAIAVLLDFEHAQEPFLQIHTKRALTGEERTTAFTLLEMEKNALLMYTSCGWFFDDIAGLEAVQVMKYAGRVLDLMAELGAIPPRGPFLQKLAEARSNDPEKGTGADIYRRSVEPLIPKRALR